MTRQVLNAALIAKGKNYVFNMWCESV